MGQRHQVYVALPNCYLCGGTGKRNDAQVKGKCNACGGNGNRYGPVVGLHHQWLYGHTTALLLRNALKFMLEQSKYSPFSPGSQDHPIHALQALYSVDVETGYYHGTSGFRWSPAHTGEPWNKWEQSTLEDPRNGDNNDGITVIDCRSIHKDTNGAPGLKYCLMRFEHWEASASESVPAFTPMSIRQYVSAYYPKSADPEQMYKPQDRLFIEQRIAAVELLDVPVMSLDDLQSIFPKMFEPKGG